MAAAAVIPVAEFSRAVLEEILDKIGKVDRKIAIGFKNVTDYTLESMGVYYESGTSDQNLPYEIPKLDALLFPARKSQGTARGSVGVFSYYIQDVNKTFHLMWSVPFDYNLYSNWWNVVVVDGREKASESVYDHMYNGTGGFPYPLKPDQWVNIENNGFNLRGSMTNNGQALLDVEIKSGQNLLDVEVKSGQNLLDVEFKA